MWIFGNASCKLWWWCELKLTLTMKRLAWLIIQAAATERRRRFQDLLKIARTTMDRTVAIQTKTATQARFAI